MTNLPRSIRSLRPYARWWWLGGPIEREQIQHELTWLSENGFGGVELAWLEPEWLSLGQPRRPKWLSSEWSDLVGFAKREADALGLGCDFTFGSCWPFGGRCVSDQDAAQDFHAASEQRLLLSWEEADDRSRPAGRILDHLSAPALRRYAAVMGAGLQEAIRAGAPSALFCDSLEIHTEALWSPRLWDEFADRMGYRLEPFVANLDDHPDVRHDYRAFVGAVLRREFYAEFSAVCHELGADARVQCHGAPTDLVAAYALADVPESEALLFPPEFSRIAASAAALAGRPVVSCETFTCLHGFVVPSDLRPLRWRRREQIADLKLLADAVFACGVNRIVWHGKPFNPPGERMEFYASVHVGPDAAMAPHLPAFNAYLTRISQLLATGRTLARLAVLLPLEDARMKGRLPDARRTPGATHHWELRHAVVPEETRGFNPLWITGPFLAAARWEDSRLCAGEASFDGLFVDCEWLERDTLVELARLAHAGLPLVLRRIPREPGHRRSPDYERLIADVRAQPSVVGSLQEATLRPLVSGQDLPPFFARTSPAGATFFFASPKAREVRYPMEPGQSLTKDVVRRPVRFDAGEAPFDVELVFHPYQAVAVWLPVGGEPELLDVHYDPPPPETED
jgi:hypothetical protein